MNFTEKELKKLPQQNDFRLRGTEMTRLETFIDATFAFSITMLVISIGEIPKNYSELILALKKIPSFLMGCVIIMFFWYSHRSWSRKYGLEDAVTILLSLSLIFVLLVYIYPLRLMSSTLFYWISGGRLPTEFSLQKLQIELPGLFQIYGIGLFVMAGLIVLLYLRARFARKILNLNKLEIIRTESEIVTFLILALSGLLSSLFAWLAPSNLNLLAGFVYSFLPIFLPITAIYYDRKEKRYKKSIDKI